MFRYEELAELVPRDQWATRSELGIPKSEAHYLEAAVARGLVFRRRVRTGPGEGRVWEYRRPPR